MRRSLFLLPLGLLLGADVPGGRSQALTAPPRCTADELLTIRNGELRCVSPLIARFGESLKCPDGFITNAIAPDPLVPTCVRRNDIDIAKYSELERRSQAVVSSAGALSQSTDSVAVYVGNTTAQSTGRIARPGTPAGLLSAHALCNDQYPGAHMCTGRDLYLSATLDVITSGKDVPKAWIYHPSWKAPLGAAQEPEAGLADNCASYSYDKDDRGWSGVAAATGILTTTRWGIRLYNGAAAPCSAALPIACCRRNPGGAP